MSVNRENVTWQSKDGTWSHGHFDFYETNMGDEDFDFEWDVEYDFSRFHWVTTGHPTADAAEARWDGANPGGGQQIPYRGNEDAATKYDALAAAAKAKAVAR